MATHKTASGKFLDIDALKIQQEKTIAVGNAKQNARGDLLGKGGQIVKTRDDIMTEFYNKQKTSRLTDNPVHNSTETAAAAAASDIFADNIGIGLDQVQESQSEPDKSVSPITPAPSSGGISDALAKSQELAERLKKQRSRI